MRVTYNPPEDEQIEDTTTAFGRRFEPGKSVEIPDASLTDTVRAKIMAHPHFEVAGNSVGTSSDGGDRKPDRQDQRGKG